MRSNRPGVETENLLAYRITTGCMRIYYRVDGVIPENTAGKYRAANLPMQRYKAACAFMCTNVYHKIHTNAIDMRSELRYDSGIGRSASRAGAAICICKRRFE